MIMNLSVTIRVALSVSAAVGALAYASSAFADAPASCVKGVDLATLGPTAAMGFLGKRNAAKGGADQGRCENKGRGFSK